MKYNKKELVRDLVELRNKPCEFHGHYLEAVELLLKYIDDELVESCFSDFDIIMDN